MNAVNDALAPRQAELWQIPATPARILAALDRAGDREGQASSGV
jgi:hypothetical protein